MLRSSERLLPWDRRTREQQRGKGSPAATSAACVTHRCSIVCREEHLNYLRSCIGAAAPHQHTPLEVEGELQLWALRGLQLCSVEIIWFGQILLLKQLSLARMEDRLPVAGFRQYTPHSVMLIYLWIYTFILILLFWRMAEHRGKCYIPDSCPCTWKDREFLSGEVIATPCYTWWVTCILHTSKSPGSSHKVKLIQKMCWVHWKSKMYMLVYRQLQYISFIMLTNRLGRVRRLLDECFFRSEKEAEDTRVKKQSRTNAWFHMYQLISERKGIWHFGEQNIMKDN